MQIIVTFRARRGGPEIATYDFPVEVDSDTTKAVATALDRFASEHPRVSWSAIEIYYPD